MRYRNGACRIQPYMSRAVGGVSLAMLGVSWTLLQPAGFSAALAPLIPTIDGLGADRLYGRWAHKKAEGSERGLFARALGDDSVMWIAWCARIVIHITPQVIVRKSGDRLEQCCPKVLFVCFQPFATQAWDQGLGCRGPEIHKSTNCSSHFYRSRRMPKLKLIT